MRFTNAGNQETAQRSGSVLRNPFDKNFIDQLRQKIKNQRDQSMISRKPSVAVEAPAPKVEKKPPTLDLAAELGYQMEIRNSLWKEGLKTGHFGAFDFRNSIRSNSIVSHAPNSGEMIRATYLDNIQEEEEQYSLPKVESKLEMLQSIDEEEREASQVT